MRLLGYLGGRQLNYLGGGSVAGRENRVYCSSIHFVPVAPAGEREELTTPTPTSKFQTRTGGGLEDVLRQTPKSSTLSRKYTPPLL